jgi:YggT family protein
MTAATVNALSFILELIFNTLQLIVIASVVISWLDANPYNPVVQMIRQVTEPMYRPLRRLLNRWSGPIDFAPMIVLMLIVTIQRFFLPVLKMKLIESLGL